MIRNKICHNSLYLHVYLYINVNTCEQLFKSSFNVCLKCFAGSMTFSQSTLYLFAMRFIIKSTQFILYKLCRPENLYISYCGSLIIFIIVNKQRAGA